MLWLGDYVYMRKKDHGNPDRVFRRYAFNRALPTLQILNQNTAHLAITDDHDYGPDDSDSSFPDRDLTDRAFRAYWANASYGDASAGKGLESRYTYGDLDFFLTDNRNFRHNPIRGGKKRKTA
jgi:alkaline phosphatase D